MENDNGEDRLSSLTDELVHRILGFLDSKEAVQTCVLSKRWVSLWKSLPYLHLGLGCGILPSEEEEEEQARLSRSFTRFITHLLARRYPTTGLVEVRLNLFYFMDPWVAESLILYALQHKAQILDVRAWSRFNDNSYIEFYNWFSNCESLTCLRLSSSGYVHDFDFIDLPKYLGLPALKSLYLCGYVMREKYFDPRIFSSCPNLETLELVHLRLCNLNTLRIHALNLRKLKITPDWMDFRDFRHRCKLEIHTPKLTTLEYIGGGHMLCSTGNLSCLDDVSFYMIHQGIHSVKLGEEDFPYLINTLKEFHHAKSLTLSLSTVQILSKIPALLEENQVSFANLKLLMLKMEKDSKNFQVPIYVLDWFRNSSTLLRIYSSRKCGQKKKELQGIKLGMELALSVGIQQSWIETDSLSTVHLFYRKKDQQHLHPLLERNTIDDYLATTAANSRSSMSTHQMQQYGHF